MCTSQFEFDSRLEFLFKADACDIICCGTAAHLQDELFHITQLLVVVKLVFMMLFIGHVVAVRDGGIIHNAMICVYVRKDNSLSCGGLA